MAPTQIVWKVWKVGIRHNTSLTIGGLKYYQCKRVREGKDKQLKLGNAEAVGTQKTAQWRELLRSVCSATDNDAQYEHFPASSNTCFGEISESIMAAFAQKAGNPDRAQQAC